MSDLDAARAPSAEDVAKTDKFDFGAKSRVLPEWQRLLAFGGCAAYSAFHLAILNFVPLDEWLFRTYHVAGGSILGFMIYALWSGERGRGVPVWDWVLIAGAIYCAWYITANLRMLVMRTGVMPTQEDYIVGLIGTILILEITRRTAGMILPLLAGAFILYAFVGPWMPGVLHHRGYSPEDFFSFTYSMEGVFGITTAASSQFIVLFVVFACFLQVSKAGDYFMNLSFALFGWVRGGPAKVAVVSGILFGTISGSAVANVVASGTFTIPMMRRVGYSKDSAAAIEATSSTGGQITPPVMGAGAFIMAELTGIPYSEIALAAVFPAILFYVANYAHVDIEAQKQNIRGLPRDELPKIGPMLADLAMLVPMVLLVLLLLSGYSVMAAGTWGIAAAVLVVLINRVGGVHSSFMLIPLAAVWTLLEFDQTPNEAGMWGIGLPALALLGYAAARTGVGHALAALKGTAHDTLLALEDGAKQSIQLVAVCACAGIIVGVLGLTGLGGRFSAMVLAIAGDSQFLALCFAMVIALVLGMGMPTTAAYAISAAVVAPGLIRMGVDPLTAHMFVFYFAVISAITPPVALASFAAAALAKSDPWKTSFESVRYGIAAFIVPFLFFYHPEILMRGTATDVTMFIVSACVGIWFIALASEGWIKGAIGWVPRAGLVVAAGLIVAGSDWIDLAGLALGGAICAWDWMRRRPARV
ncbi:MAG: TRAP transporter permease [Azospirillum sp.]|nr:TRAP transporter permease [Azospirillum sp.]MCZ8125287.1 TRAP transporter permease [Magnetospirillum sp.]